MYSKGESYITPSFGNGPVTLARVRACGSCWLACAGCEACWTQPLARVWFVSRDACPAAERRPFHSQAAFAHLPGKLSWSCCACPPRCGGECVHLGVGRVNGVYVLFCCFCLCLKMPGLSMLPFLFLSKLLEAALSGAFSLYVSSIWS